LYFHITIYDVAHLTASAFDEAFNRKNIIFGFLKTGCYPFNKNIFSCEDFIGAQVTEVDDPSQHVNTNDLGPDDANLPKCKMPSTSSDSHPHVNSFTSALNTKNDLKIVIHCSKKLGEHFFRNL
jgi:hypothetical protein